MLIIKHHLLKPLVTALLLSTFVGSAFANQAGSTENSPIIKEKARSLLNQMSLDKKISILSGRGYV